MKSFMDDNFLLTTETARELFQETAKKMPIWIIIVTLILKKLQRIEDLKILRRCGLVETITNGD